MNTNFRRLAVVVLGLLTSPPTMGQLTARTIRQKPGCGFGRSGMFPNETGRSKTGCAGTSGAQTAPAKLPSAAPGASQDIGAVRARRVRKDDGQNSVAKPFSTVAAAGPLVWLAEPAFAAHCLHRRGARRERTDDERESRGPGQTGHGVAGPLGNRARLWAAFTTKHCNGTRTWSWLTPNWLS